MAAVALTGSLMATSTAVRMDQREKAALAALDDYGAMVGKLGVESSLIAANITAADAAYLSAWLSVFVHSRICVDMQGMITHERTRG